MHGATSKGSAYEDYNCMPKQDLSFMIAFAFVTVAEVQKLHSFSSKGTQFEGLLKLYGIVIWDWTKSTFKNLKYLVQNKGNSLQCVTNLLRDATLRWFSPCSASFMPGYLIKYSVKIGFIRKYM